MPPRAPRSFNREVLRSLRDQLSYDATEVASLSGQGNEVYREIEDGAVEPSQAQVRALAKFFRVDEFNFFRSTPPRSSRRIDFRTGLAGYRGEPGPILDAIHLADGIQSLLETVVDFSISWKSGNRRRINLNSDTESEALYWRQIIAINDESQLGTVSHGQFFTYFRSKIESLGIGVIVASFEEKYLKGLSYATTSNVPVILINSFAQRREGLD